MAVKNIDVLQGREDLTELLLSLGTKWGDAIDRKDLKQFHLSGAMTNEVHRVGWPSKRVENGRDRYVLVRVYGDGLDVFFDRGEEISTFKSLSEHGYGPKLLGHFEGGRVEEFIHARVWFLILILNFLHVFAFNCEIMIEVIVDLDSCLCSCFQILRLSFDFRLYLCI